MLSVKALALTGAIMWGGVVFLCAVGTLVWPPYGEALLDVARSIYPGFAATTGFTALLVGTAYAALDGFVLGAAFAWIYNRLAGRSGTREA